MTEMPEKKGHMRLVVDVEVNEELMDVAKDAISKMSTRLPEIMRRGNQEKQEE
jgi:hypothetical protein